MSLDMLIAELVSRNVRLTVCAGQLRYSPTDLLPELVAGLREHKAELVAMLTPPIESDIESNLDDDFDEELDPFERAIIPPPPCPSCGTWELWQSLLGDWRCVNCNPPLEAARWRENALRLKKRSHRIASNAISHAPSTLTSTATTDP
jgi:hypothetical protein